MTNTFLRRLLLLLPLLLAAPAWAGTYYVAPDGDDANPGTAAEPFATLERARDAVRASGQAGKEAVTIKIKGGVYRRGEAFKLEAADSGSAAHPVVYEGIGDAPARLTSATVVETKDFTPVKDPLHLGRIPETARPHVRVLDLAALGIGYADAYPGVFTDNGGIFELFFNNKRMPISIYPNEQGKMTMKRVLENGNPKNVNGVFEYREEHDAMHKKMAAVVDRGVWIKGYWRVVWQNEAVRVGSIDTEARTVTLGGHVTHGIGSKYKRPQGSGEEVYWVMNLLEAVDQPGEWAVDFKDRKLFFYPPGDLGRADILITDTKTPVIEADNASHIELRGLVFEGTLGHGVHIRGGENVRIVGCTVRNVANYGIAVKGGKKHAVRSSDLYALGAGGIALTGGDAEATPRVPAGHLVENCDIHHFGEIQKVYAPGINVGFDGGGGGSRVVDAVGMVVRHNAIHHGPHAGVLFNSYDNLFEYNEVFHFALLSNDMGAFYSYAKPGGIGNNTFRYNFMHSSPQGDGVYYDNLANQPKIYGNISYRLGPTEVVKSGKRGCGFLMKNFNNSPVEIYNNIAINCRIGYWINAGEGSTFRDNLAVNCGDNIGTDGLGLTRYDQDPGFVDLAKLDFRLRDDARVYSDLPGFKPILFEKIGLYKDDYRASLPPYREVATRWVPGEPPIAYEILDR
ncbi:MAG: right-handed parallel beta-helix repeat-containing protein [Planctomycetota bacterium]